MSVTRQIHNARRHAFVWSFSIAVGAIPFAQDSLVGQWPDPAAPVGNPFDLATMATQEAIGLGTMLFWDEQLSTDNTVSCGTCHTHSAGGADLRPAGVHPPTGHFGSHGMLPQGGNGEYFDDPVFGVSRRVTDFNAPSAIGAAFFDQLFWNKRVGPGFEGGSGATLPGFEANAALEQQASVPPIDPTEMASDGTDWASVVAKIASAQPLRIASSIPASLQSWIGPTTTYEDLFTLVYGPGSGGSAVDRERVAMALATYERSLVPDQAPFDSGLMTAAQVNGFEIFKSAPTRNQFATTCSACHSTDLFRGFETDSGGALVDSNDNLFSDGNRHQTGLPGNAVPFKTPSLRNVGLRRRFMHDGRFDSLDAVLDFYNASPDAKFGFEPALNSADLADLKDFLENALTDPRVAAATGPFERPGLWTELVPFESNHYGEGTGDLAVPDPTMLANAPAHLGNADFKIGVGDATPGALARLGIASLPGPAQFGAFELWVDPATVTWTVMNLNADGTGTHFVPVPNDLLLLGVPFYAQWGVVDPLAQHGAVTSVAASFLRF